MRVSRSWQTGAAALLLFLPWANPLAAGPSPAVQPWLTTAACVLVLWLLVVAWGGSPRPRLVLPALLVVAWAALSQAELRPEVLMLAGALALVALAAGLAGEEAVAGGLQLGLVAAAGLGAALGLAQYLGFAQEPGLLFNAAPPGVAYANLRQPNLYATACAIGAAVILWGRWRPPLAARAVLMALLGAGSAASVSRTGLLQLLLLVVLAAAWRDGARRERLLMGGAALAAHVLAALALPLLLQAVAGLDPDRTLWARIEADAGCSSRLVLWSNVLELMAQRPVTGWGWGELDYAHYLHLYGGARFCDILDNAHNLPLHLAVELGIPAALVLVVGALLWVWRQRPWQEPEPGRRLAWVLLALLAVHSLLEYPLWYGPFQVVFGAALGTLLPPAGPAGGAARLRAGALGAALLLATGYAAWDYLRVSQIYLQPQERRPAWRDDTLAHVRRSWLFAGQAGFADLTLAFPAPGNAARINELARRTLHYSPEPRVIERLIESATLLGRDDEAVLHLARYRAAFPADYARWRAQRLGAAAGAPDQMSRLRRTLEKASGSSSSLLGRVSRT